MTNAMLWLCDPATPFGGCGRSDGGELGRHSIEEILETKSVQL